MIEAIENKYKLIKDNGFDKEDFLERITDYFKEYDYIVGDYAYGKLRLKGFNSNKNKNFSEINDIGKVEKYIIENCAYGCKNFILEKEK